MSPSELRASLSLASIFGLRLFGMFVILPVFSLYAQGRPGWNLTLVGVALGAYGITQAILQLPFGWLSDRRGRKPVMYAGLFLFAVGSFTCASSDHPWVVIAGRVLQGAGAISAVAMAAAADLTRDSQRTKAMAIIGSTIGVVFAVSFIAAPFLQQVIGVPGIFAMTGVLALTAIGVVRFVVPDAPAKEHDRTVSLGTVFRDRELVRLNIGIFSLHAVLMAMFIVVPIGLVHAGLPASSHRWVYLGAVGAGFLLMLPGIMGPWAQKERTVFLGSIAMVAIGMAILVFALDSLAGIVAALVIFFTGFNVLEAKLPALVSKAAPREAVGSATGIYSSVQFLGTFVGGAAGGVIAQHAGFAAVLAACLALTLAWLAAAWNMGQFVAAHAPRA
ncbi:MAG TPA: MFS transporter [Usitatibacter sp.]|nr:MFS transporter [Usitatibacter sp.]